MRTRWPASASGPASDAPLKEIIAIERKGRDVPGKLDGKVAFITLPVDAGHPNNK